MREREAVEQAIGSLKAHGCTYRELKKSIGKGPHSAAEIINGCAVLIRAKGHDECAQGLLEMKWSDAPSA